MKKLIILGILAVVIILMTFSVTAETVPTLVAGVIYEADHTTPISGALVEATCDSVTLSQADSNADGSYSIDFSGTACSKGDTVYVTATADGGASGSNEGEVIEYSFNFVCPDEECLLTKIDVAVVNVSIPEFGILAGSACIIGALAGFLVLRRKE
jgi:hypothetical protein